MGLTTDNEFYYLNIPAGMDIRDAARGALTLSVSWNHWVSFVFSGVIVDVHPELDSVSKIVDQFRTKIKGNE